MSDYPDWWSPYLLLHAELWILTHSQFSAPKQLPADSRKISLSNPCLQIDYIHFHWNLPAFLYQNLLNLSQVMPAE